MGFQTGGFAGFWLGGQCPLAAWGEENFENLTMKWCILKYIYVVRTALFSTPACPDCSQMFRKLLLFCMFRFLIFHPFFQGGSTGPICTYVRTPMIFKVACMAGVRDRWCVKTKWSWELASDTRRFVLRDKTARIKKTRTAVGTSFRDVRRYAEYRDGHGLGPSTGWVGLGRIFQHMWWVGLRWVEWEVLWHCSWIL